MLAINLPAALAVMRARDMHERHATEDGRECAKWLNAPIELSYSGWSSSSPGSRHDGGGDRPLPILELAASQLVNLEPPEECAWACIRRS